jgi:hypothetical protein
MIEVERIPEESIRKAMDEGDFGPEIREAAPRTAVVLTQSWCPQWTAMQRGFDRLGKKGEPADGHLKIWTLEYDRHPDFERIRRFKEEHFGSRNIPYVRYYRDGEYLGNSNFVTGRKLLRQFEGRKTAQ